MKTDLKFFIATSLIVTSVCLGDIQIDMRSINPDGVEITCHGYDYTVAMIKVYRGQKHLESVIKVIISNGKCDVDLSTDPYELDVKCLCQSINSLICKVSSVNAEDKWQCAALRYQDKNPMLSRIISLSGYNENGITIEQTTMSSTINYKKQTFKDVTSDQTNFYRDNEEMHVSDGVSKETQDDTFIIVFATSGGLIILLAVVLISTYWNCIRNTGGVLTPVVENHNLTPLGDNPRLSEYVVGREASGNRSDGIAQRHFENNYLTPVIDKPRLSEYVVGREASGNRSDGIAQQHFENNYLTPVRDNPRLSEYVVGREASGNRSDGIPQRHFENNYLTPLGDNPRISQFAIGRQTHVNRNDNIPRGRFENIDCDLQSIVNACVTNGDVESRANDERTSESYYDIISDNTQEMPYAEIPIFNDIGDA